MEKYRKIDEFYIERDEEAFIEYLLPQHCIDQKIEENKADIDYYVRFLQNELNNLLNSFLNGGFSYKGFIFYPFIKDVSKDNINKIKKLKKIADFLNENGYDFSGSIKSYKGCINAKSFAAILSALYRDFSFIKNKDVNHTKKGKCKEFEIRSYNKSDLEYLKPLNELKGYANSDLNQYLLGFYLHGSFATKDYIRGWSDVDTLSIISKRTIDDPELLLKLREKFYNMRYFFYKIDPLQHHGSIIIGEYDLKNYCQTYFPIPIFSYAKSFFKNDAVNQLMSRDFSSEAITRLFWFVNHFRRLNIENRFKLGSYDTKTLLHIITLFPSIYLQSKGKLVYKKFSFGIAKKDFKKEVWNVMDGVSSIRSNWKYSSTIPLMHSISKINPLLCYQLNSRVLDLFKDIRKVNKIDTKTIIKTMFKLSEEAWSMVKEDVKSKRL